ncbi:hypothetical protein GGX14DRAFT_405849 [Mycena pura]|uniref:Uncharacterized protein n=1 Tax=Mycena pura TaxID=153505 RepID=A0AAD6UT62_9AGAR|nr:hypothetical protein GGX14DRAFT_405849 [Mycena pura]
MFTEKGSVNMKRSTVRQIHCRPRNQNYMVVMRWAQAMWSFTQSPRFVEPDLPVPLPQWFELPRRGVRVISEAVRTVSDAQPSDPYAHRRGHVLRREASRRCVYFEYLELLLVEVARASHECAAVQSTLAARAQQPALGINARVADRRPAARASQRINTTRSQPVLMDATRVTCTRRGWRAHSAGDVQRAGDAVHRAGVACRGQQGRAEGGDGVQRTDGGVQRAAAEGMGGDGGVQRVPATCTVHTRAVPGRWQLWPWHAEGTGNAQTAAGVFRGSGNVQRAVVMCIGRWWRAEGRRHST